MERCLGMRIMYGLLFGSVLLAAACGREQSVASKSAAAYEEAKAKGIAVGGGHDHENGGHGAEQPATTETAVDHSAHGTAADAHAGMNHGSTSTGGAMDHSAHDGSVAAVDHMAMGHGATEHSGRTTAGADRGAHDAHAGMQHEPARPAGDAHAQHQQQAAAAHAQHGAMQHGTTPTAMQHGAHSVTTAPTSPAAVAPRSNSDMQLVRPASTLQPDAFDAPAAASVAEAAKASQGGGHEGHGTRGPAPVDHSQQGAARPATQPAAAVVYTCPMHPEVRSGEPGTCPKCGMTLVKQN
ncbi:MAG TPA: heavy metal-binding domain-containing protein [Thermoanaerobaculia bacterium]|jgi:hypothetical protein|nr:heavy metal-binding domain-containing protein [Thermoanaerobaculia bacterium]